MVFLVSAARDSRLVHICLRNAATSYGMGCFCTSLPIRCRFFDSQFLGTHHTYRDGMNADLVAAKERNVILTRCMWQISAFSITNDAFIW